MGLLSDHPGFLYVLATLLPLASFVVLILVAALRTACRPYRDTDTVGATLFRALGGDIPRKWPAYVATGAMGLACVLSLIGFILFRIDAVKAHGHTGEATETHPVIVEGEKAEPAGEVKKHRTIHDEMEDRWSGRVEWARIGTIGGSSRATVLQLGYHVDGLTVAMFLMITFVGTLIHVFSIGYMGDELAPIVEDHQVHTEEGHLHRRGRFGRFFLFLSLFSFSMLNLILADNLFQVFVSWELVGLCSYLLIGFYYERRSAADAANKAFITNRIGDAGFIIGVMILWTYVGTLNFEDLFRQVRAPIQNGFDQSGRIIRGDVVSAAPDGKHLNLRLAANGSQVLLFPAQTAKVEDIKPEATVPTATNPGPADFGSMPYWLLVVAGLGIFLGCVGKSAQFPLHVWLPDAMEGPTPVSALIHAATMVAAGVYLVGRVFPLFPYEARLVIAYTGGITLFVAATIAIVMTDIKKVLAYSTVSQLGYMMLALGVGGWVAGLFHLLTHAFFKALLFLCSGSVIYGCHHEQEMTKMGGLYPKMKVTALTMLMGVLAISGVPFFTGWYSKDAILAQALGFSMSYPQHGLLFLLPLVTAGLTAFYMFRMWFMTFTGEPRDAHVYEHAHESPRVMTVPLIILAVCSVCVAWGWPIWSAEKSYLGEHIHHAQPGSVQVDYGTVLEEGETLPGRALAVAQNARRYAADNHFLAGMLAMGIGGLGIVFAMLIYYARKLDAAEAAEQFPALHRFLLNKWYVDELYSALLVRPALVVATWCRSFDLRAIDGTVNGLARATVRLSYWSGKFDLGIVDGLVNVLARATWGLGARLRNVQTGYLRSYVLFLVLAVVCIFLLLSYVVVALAKT
jgi:NADH-quinone oxidoreductase subunit L